MEKEQLGARMITNDDINKITGYNPTKTGDDGKPYGDGNLDEYNNEVLYTKNNDSIEYRDTLNNKAGRNEDPTAIFRYYDRDKKAWVQLLPENGKNQVTLKTDFYYYFADTLSTKTTSNKVNGLEKESDEYKLLFNNEIEDYYWVGSSYLLAREGFIDYGIYYIDNGYMFYALLGNSFGYIYDKGLGIRPVVSLKEDISIYGGDGKAKDTAYQIHD